MMKIIVRMMVINCNIGEGKDCIFCLSYLFKICIPAGNFCVIILGQKIADYIGVHFNVRL